MLHLCFAGGLRVSELVGIRVVDVRLQPEPNVLDSRQGPERALYSAVEAKPRRRYALGYPSEGRSWLQSYLSMLATDV